MWVIESSNKAKGHSRWAELRGVEIGTLMVALQARTNVIGQAKVGLLGIRKAPERVGMVHGLAQRRLAIRSKERDSAK